MPSVNLSLETYEKLKQLADERGCTPEAAIELAVSRELRSERLSPGEWQREWDSLVASIRARIPEDNSPEELEADIDVAVAEARAKRRARSH
jgi:hypothetical protein